MKIYDYHKVDSGKLCRLCENRHSIYINCAQNIGLRRAIKIAREHKRHKFCKHWQECSKCTVTKFWIRLMRHIVGDCKNNMNKNKCPACYSKYHHSINLVNYYGKKRIVKNIYKAMLA